MEVKKKDNILKRSINIKVVEMDLPDLDADPFFIKKKEQAIKDLLENPPPEWIQKKMRGED